MQIQVTFEIGTDVDQAALNVNNRVKQAEPRLPQEVRRQGVTVEKGSSAFLQVLAFYSPDGRCDDLFISQLRDAERARRSSSACPGTTNVQIFGAKDYAMRIWLQPDRLAQLQAHHRATSSRAINEQNAQFAAGKVGQSPDRRAAGAGLHHHHPGPARRAEASSRTSSCAPTRDGSTLRLKDVARVELGSKDYDFIGRVNGKPATLVGIFLQPGANALEVADRRASATMDELAQALPAGPRPTRSRTTPRASSRSRSDEVVITLVEAMVLVFLVVFLFLQNWRATLIPFAGGAGVADRHLRRAARCSATRSTR